MRSGTIAMAVLMMALVGTACASDDGGGAGAASGGATTGSTGDASAGGGGYGRGSYGTTGATGGSATADLTVTAVNYRFDPSSITATSGDVIEVRDTNPQTPHTFTVRGTDIDLAVDPRARAP